MDVNPISTNAWYKVLRNGERVAKRFKAAPYQFEALRKFGNGPLHVDYSTDFVPHDPVRNTGMLPIDQFTTIHNIDEPFMFIETDLNLEGLKAGKSRVETMLEQLAKEKPTWDEKFKSIIQPKFRFTPRGKREIELYRAMEVLYAWHPRIMNHPNSYFARRPGVHDLVGWIHDFEVAMSVLDLNCHPSLYQQYLLNVDLDGVETKSALEWYEILMNVDEAIKNSYVAPTNALITYICMTAMPDSVRVSNQMVNILKHLYAKLSKGKDATTPGVQKSLRPQQLQDVRPEFVRTAAQAIYSLGWIGNIGLFTVKGNNDAGRLVVKPEAMQGLGNLMDIDDVKEVVINNAKELQDFIANYVPEIKVKEEKEEQKTMSIDTIDSVWVDKDMKFAAQSLINAMQQLPENRLTSFIKDNSVIIVNNDKISRDVLSDLLEGLGELSILNGKTTTELEVLKQAKFTVDKDMEACESKLEELVNEKNTLLTTIADLETANTNLQQVIDSSSDDEKIAESGRQLKEANEKLGKVQQQLSKSKETNVNMLNDLKKKTSEVAKLKDTLKEKNKQLENAKNNKSETEKFMKEIEDLEKKIKDMEKTRDEAFKDNEKALKEKIEEVEKLERGISWLQTKLDAQTGSLQGAEKLLEQKTQTITDLQRDIEFFKNDITNRVERINELENIVTTLEAKLKSQQQVTNQITNERNDLNTKLEFVQNDLNNSKQLLRRTSAELELFQSATPTKYEEKFQMVDVENQGYNESKTLMQNIMRRDLSAFDTDPYQQAFIVALAHLYREVSSMQNIDEETLEWRKGQVNSLVNNLALLKQDDVDVQTYMFFKMFATQMNSPDALLTLLKAYNTPRMLGNEYNYRYAEYIGVAFAQLFPQQKENYFKLNRQFMLAVNYVNQLFDDSGLGYHRRLEVLRAKIAEHANDQNPTAVAVTNLLDQNIMHFHGVIERNREKVLRHLAIAYLNHFYGVGGLLNIAYGGNYLQVPYYSMISNFAYDGPKKHAIEVNPYLPIAYPVNKEIEPLSQMVPYLKQLGNQNTRNLLHIIKKVPDIPVTDYYTKNMEQIYHEYFSRVFGSDHRAEIILLKCIPKITMSNAVITFQEPLLDVPGSVDNDVI